MLKTSDMASFKAPDPKRRQKDTVINNLKDLFGNVHIDIIRSVASECNFDVQRSSNILIEMTSNIQEPPFRKKEKPKKKPSPQHTPPPKTPICVPARPQVVKSKKSLEVERVIGNIRQGYKVLVILRGLPGSGKSRMAVAITDVTLGPGNNSHHILSTDDFFMQQRGYVFDANKLSEAHEWNHGRAFRAMSRGLSPVVIDNTNTQMWEMKPYAMMATDYGYMIEILEPDTWWAFNDKELARRNTHGVPRVKLQDMLLRYEKNVTAQKLMCAYNLMYKFQKPPQYRLLPPVSNNVANVRLPVTNGVYDGVTKSKSVPDFDVGNLMDFSEVPNGDSSGVDNQNVLTNPVDEILMFTEENTVEVLQPDPVRSTTSRLFPDIENAWGISEKALQSWELVTPVQYDGREASATMLTNQEETKKETRDNSSCVEPGDYLKDTMEVPFGFRVVTAYNRDINYGFGSPARNNAPPKKIMVDQSSTTDDIDLEHVDDEQSRIEELLAIFPRIPKSSLRELYYKCHKNFGWTVDLLLEDDNLEVAAEVQPDEEEPPVVEEVAAPKLEEDPQEDPNLLKRKTAYEDSLELKRCLESKFDISKDHYSEHVYRVKQTKFGLPNEPQPSTSTNCNSDFDSDDEGSIQSDDNPKNMVEINLGETFVNQLETLFSGDDQAFPKGFQPVVQMPVSLAQQIYSFYVESLCQQMEAQNNILDRLVKEDEEFARKLQQEEAPTPVSTAVPNLSEIMDEQVALNLHQRDVDGWKNITADSLAAKLTKQKLFSAFPHIDKEAMLEIWHAYDYDYNKTVEVLIASVGTGNVNEAVNGNVNEPPLSDTTLKEMKQAEEYCVVVEAQGPDEQKPATYYREEANTHLAKRAQLYEKAKSYYQRGMTEVAMFYSELAKRETQYYDRANHFAAAAFVDEHSKRLQKFDTLDLHYLYVKEAIPNLDLFIDRNINLLKGSAKRGQDLFVITGRGKNSEGGVSKIKPAVIGRLKKRKIGFVQLNPGLLKIRVQRDSMITSDIP